MKALKNLLLCFKRQFVNSVMETIMRQSLRVLLVTALVAPLFFLTACCGKCDDKCTYDKMGAKYDACQECPVK
jgi:hypothetical protein